MNIFEKIDLFFYAKKYEIADKRALRKYKKLYPDYVDDNNNEGSLKHIWGITSGDDLSGSNSNLYTMNDIDITYDRDTKKYMLGIEMAYIFKNRKSECKYLKSLLEYFDNYMDENNLSKNEDFFFYGFSGENLLIANSIEELYTNFRIFVEGFCKIYN